SAGLRFLIERQDQPPWTGITAPVRATIIWDSHMSGHPTKQPRNTNKHLQKAMRVKHSLIIGLLLGAGAIALWALPQEDKAKDKKKEEPYTLQVDVDLVNLAVAVANPSGNFLTDLKKANFTVYEDKVEQKITNFATVDAPFAVALVLDTSGSTEG